MTELFYSKLCIALAISAVSFMISAGTWFEIFVHKRNELRTKQYMESMLGRGVFFMRLGVFSLFVALVAAIMNWCL